MNPDDIHTWDVDWTLNEHVDWTSDGVTEKTPIGHHSWVDAIHQEWAKQVQADVEKSPLKLGGYVHEPFWTGGPKPLKGAHVPEDYFWEDKPKPKAKATDNAKLASTLMGKVPGLRVVVEFPCECGYGGIKSSGQVQDAIIHLNDNHHPWKKPAAGDAWSRERIADWLDTLDVILTIDNKGRVIADGVTFWQVITPGNKFQNKFFVSKDLAIDYAHGLVGSNQRTILKECVDTIQFPLFDSKGMGGIKASRNALNALGGKHERDAEPEKVAPTEDEAMQELLQAMTSISADLSQAFANLGKALAPSLEQLKTLIDSELGQALLAEANKKENS